MHPFEDLPVPAGKIGLHWFGQNSFALKDSAGTVLQVDPYFPWDRPDTQFLHRRPPLHEATLRTDLVLLTHDHGDHTCVESLSRLRDAFPAALYVGPSESMDRLRRSGFVADRLRPIAAGERWQWGSIAVNAVWSKPAGGLPDDGIAPPDVQHLGYVVEAEAERVYITGDLVNTFANHEELLAPVRALEPTIGILTTHPTEGEFPDFAGCSRLAAELRLRAAVPAHYGCFVSRTYDPSQWAAQLQGVLPVVIGYNQAVLYPPED
jgi:L-ascorbate metabolism protein UlaG (beta-lactamase superfamily)